MTVRRAMIWIAVAALVCVPLTWLARAVSVTREVARSSQCTGNLKQIAVALLNYETAYGCFPPAYVADARGRPLYSWRVLLMAELDRGPAGYLGGRLVKNFHFDEPWDSPNNRKLHDLVWASFQCPSGPSGPTSTETNYVAVVGPTTMFPDDGTSRRLADATDGPGKTFMVVEIANSGIHWMEPRDLDWRTMSFQLNDRTRPSVSSHHPFNGPHAQTVDGSIYMLPRNLTSEELRALLTIAGGEKIDPGEWTSER